MTLCSVLSLLDRNNHVVAIGNPAYNVGIAGIIPSHYFRKKTFNEGGTQMITVDDSKKKSEKSDWEKF